jgi:hypothetical protein
MTIVDCERFSIFDQLQTIWLRVMPEEEPIPEDVDLPARWADARVEVQLALAWIGREGRP